MGYGFLLRYTVLLFSSYCSETIQLLRQTCVPIQQWSWLPWTSGGALQRPVGHSLWRLLLQLRCWCCVWNGRLLGCYLYDKIRPRNWYALIIILQATYNRIHNFKGPSGWIILAVPPETKYWKTAVAWTGAAPAITAAIQMMSEWSVDLVRKLYVASTLQMQLVTLIHFACPFMIRWGWLSTRTQSCRTIRICKLYHNHLGGE